MVDSAADFVSVAVPDRSAELEAKLEDALERNQQIEIELSHAVARAGDLQRELEHERALRLTLQEASDFDLTMVEAIERIIRRHADERAQMNERLDAAAARLAAATIRHEQAMMDLVERHRTEVSRRLDQVLDQNRALFNRITSTIQDLWTTRGTTRPSIEKEHWFLLAREEEDASDGDKIVTFRIHSGQKVYIDKIGKTKDVIVASPAANGVDVRQMTKKRMRDLVGDHDDIDIDALKFSCSNPDKVQGFFALLVESIDAALAAPSTDIFRELEDEASENLREIFCVDSLFAPVAAIA